MGKYKRGTTLYDYCLLEGETCFLINLTMRKTGPPPPTITPNPPMSAYGSPTPADTPANSGSLTKPESAARDAPPA